MTIRLDTGLLVLAPSPVAGPLAVVVEPVRAQAHPVDVG